MKAVLKPLMTGIMLSTLLGCSGEEKTTADRAKAVVMDKDISFIAIGKASNYRQHQDKTLEILNHTFFAEVFITEEGIALNGFLKHPTGTSNLVPMDHLLKFKGPRSKNIKEIARDYPDGSYQISFENSSGNISRSFDVKSTGPSGNILSPITISLSQDNREVQAGLIDPTKDLTVRWTAFTEGRADPNGVLDDPIFVSLVDCHSRRVDHSGHIFEGTPYLTYRNDLYVISKDLLKSGLKYPMFVEHVIADTKIVEGIADLTSYATITYLTFETTGTNKGEQCPDIIPRIEPGETDRPDAGYIR